MKQPYLIWLYPLFAAFILPVFARQEPPLPIDPQLRYGRLPNGLTYYIRHNTHPRERADFYIVQRAGSTQEDDSQAGLAHFLEHMAFNGTRHFPGKQLTDYLEKIGVRFSHNLNAYTNFDETVYMVKDVPVVRESITDSCLLILHDWSNALLLEDEMIEKERGVIHEEWRTRNNAEIRIMEKKLPLLMPGSRYACRMPIGKMEVVDHFKLAVLRNYYKKWYRPDLQAVIVVGDIDAARVEDKLKKLFRDVPAPVDPAERIMYPVPDPGRPPVSVVTDKEAPTPLFSILYKHDVMPRELYATRAGLIHDYLLLIASGLIDDLLVKSIYTADPPFIYAYCSYGKYLGAKTKNVWEMTAAAKEGEIGKAVAALTKETRRIKKFGFTRAQYERVKNNLLQSYESLYNDRNKQNNSLFTEQYVDHFTEGGYLPGIETEYALLREVASCISLDDVNRFVRDLIADDNFALSLTGPEKTGLVYPSSDELLRIYREALQQEVEPYREQVSDGPLVDKLPEPGKIVSATENPAFGATEWLLSNGVRVVLKKTDFKENEIRLKASRPGGSSLFHAADKVNFLLMVDAVKGTDPGTFNPLDLREYLTGKHNVRQGWPGKQVSLSASTRTDCEQLKGSATPRDLKTLFESIYLTFTPPVKNPVNYRLFTARLKERLQSLEADPLTSFIDEMCALLYDNNPRKMRIKSTETDQADYDRILELYRERFGHATGFLFTFAGNIDLDSIRPYVEQYLATLPVRKEPQKANEENAVPTHPGRLVKHFRRPMETPQASVADLYTGKVAYTPENLLAADVLAQILDIVYKEKVREEASGTYGVNVSAAITSFPATSGQLALEMYFTTAPARFKSLNQIVHRELKQIARKGPRITDLNKTKENMLKKQAEQLQENDFWLDRLDEYYSRGIDRLTCHEALLNAMTPQKIKTFVDNLLSQGNRIELVMLPEKTPERKGK